MAIRVSWGHMGPPILGKGRSYGVSDGTIRKSDGGSYKVSIVTVALSVTIRLQSAIECLQRSNQQGWVTLGPNFRLLPLE